MKQVFIALMSRWMVGALLAACVGTMAFGKSKPTLKYAPPPADPEERPVATEFEIAPRGSDIAVGVTFDKLPWGEDCKLRCANLTVFLDTDNDRSTGLKLDIPEAAETGADLAVTIQGLKEYREQSVRNLVRVKVRLLGHDEQALEGGELLGEWNHRDDPDRVKAEGKTVRVWVDASHGAIPLGKTMRVIYHPPGSKALVATTRGIRTSPGRNRVNIIRPKP